ncbi:DEAD/DEAH box helicase [bacterium]|nr:MAG: DEAD/DEAH box helicase [bacterium]
MNDVFADLLGDPTVAEQIGHLESMPARGAQWADTPFVHPALAARLEELGFKNLYSHQALAAEEAMRGRDVCLVTGTNSGKTLGYALPALDFCLREPMAKVLMLYPTKALAQDQLGRLSDLAPAGIRAATYDGDTPQAKRSEVRRTSHLILTNPDMLHTGILPNHESWAKFFKSLRMIVIDEMHVYRGIFGSHVANVLRRLLRIAEWHRAKPVVMGCSATIGNPGDLFRKLTSREPVIVDQDGSPQGRRTFVFHNPPEVAPGRRLSANVAASEMVATLAEAGLRTLAFSRARVSAELVLRYTRDRLERGGLVPPDRVESYRAGYTPVERREIERGLFEGRLAALSATNAMELGVDVGGLDAVVINGYPGTASSFWQQAGRAGRGSRDGLAVLVAHDDPLEQWLLRNPRTLLEARNENVALNPENRHVLVRHLLCAAYERPIAPSELQRFGDGALELAEDLDRSGELQFSAGLFVYPGFDPPALKTSLRSGSGETVSLMLEDGTELGTMERWRAFTGAHEGAIYLHRGQQFEVSLLDLDQNLARVRPTTAPYYTQAVVQSIIEAKAELGAFSVGPLVARLCGLKVTDIVTSFRKKTLDGDTVLSVEELELPPQSYETIGIRFDLPPLMEEEDLIRQMGGVHGLEHALAAVAPFLAGCDRGDLGSSWYATAPDTLRPAVYVFDRMPGGVGLAERLFAGLVPWLRAGHQLLASCDCEEGCPACLLSPRCECANEVLHKGRTMELLAGV